MISEKTLQHPILTGMVFLMLLVIGLFTISNISIALFPDIDMPYLSVSASYTNADPESVENSVTKVIENALVSLSHLESISSSSSEGRSSVSLEFAYGTDLDQAANDVREKLDRVTRALPDDVTPTIFKMDASASPIMRIAVRGNRSADDLKQYAENTIVDMLEQADGVGEASAMGGRQKLVRVELELNRLQAYGLTLSTVASALSRQNIDLGGGSITEGKMDYSIRTSGLYNSVNEIKETVIKTVNGYDVKLSDIGTAYLGYKDASNEVYINGDPGVYVSITKQSGTNTVTVANAVYKKIDEIEKILPSDMHLEIISDSSESIRDTLNTLLTSAWQGLILAVVILYIFLCSFKSTIIIAISIPLSIIITVLCMNYVGITLNLVTLTGLILGVGMIVDASIVMIDNIYSYRSRGTKPKIAAILGSQEMLMSVLSGNLTTICVFVPFLFFLKDLGFMGQMFKGIIFTVVISLVSSLFVAIFLVPVLAGHFFPLTNRNEKPVRSSFFRNLYKMLNSIQGFIRDRLYRPLLKTALKHRFITVLVCATALIVSLLMIPTMRISMMTGGSDSSVTLSIRMPIGTTLAETTKTVNEFQKIIENEIKGYKTLIVTTGASGRNRTSYSGSIEIVLPDTEQQIDDSATIQSKLRAHFAEYPDATLSFGRGMRQQMTGDDIDVVLRSSSLDDAMVVAEKIADVMNSIDDIGEASIDTTNGLPQIEIVVDRERAYNFGVSVSAVAREIQACIEGTTATTYTQDGEDYTVSVMLRSDDIQSVPDLEQIFVQGNNGLVAVSNIASVRKGFGPVTIRRENRSRIVHVTASIITQQNANVVEDEIKERIAASLIIPDDVSVSYEGSWKSMNDQFKTYAKIILLAIMLVFGVMAATYESFKAPIINIMTIPFIVIGVVAIYKITNQTFSMLSLIGIIMLVGIVVNNGIILVDYTNLLIDRGYKKLDACLEAGTSRLRPVLMTTLTTILGMLPMCFATSGSAGMVQPIGVAVVGGLTSSTLITLIFIPVMYSLIMSEKKTSKSRIKVTLPGQTKQEFAEGLESVQPVTAELAKPAESTAAEQEPLPEEQTFEEPLIADIEEKPVIAAEFEEPAENLSEEQEESVSVPDDVDFYAEPALAPETEPAPEPQIAKVSASESTDGDFDSFFDDIEESESSDDDWGNFMNDDDDDIGELVIDDEPELAPASEKPTVLQFVEPVEPVKPRAKVMPKKEELVSNDHHIAEFKLMDRIAAKHSVRNHKKVSSGSFVAYRPGNID